MSMNTVEADAVLATHRIQKILNTFLDDTGCVLNIKQMAVCVGAAYKPTCIDVTGTVTMEVSA